MRLRGLLATWFLLTVAQGAAAADWPSLRGPSSDNAYRGETVLHDASDLGLEVVWKHDLGYGYSGVSVSSDHAVTAFSDGTDDVVIAFDTATGEQLWRYAVAPTHRGTDGSHDGPLSTSLIAGGRVFFLGPFGDLVALSLKTGERIWSTQLTKDRDRVPPLFGFGASPFYAEGVVVVPAGSQIGPPGAPPGKAPALLGLDAASGNVLWQAGQTSISYQSPMAATVGGIPLVLAASDLFLLGLDGKTGKVFWQVPHQGQLYPGPGTSSMNPVPLGGGRFFVSDSPNGSSAIELTPNENGMNLTRIWSDRSIRNSYAIPVFLDGYLYGYSSGFLTCVDAATGQSVWRSRQPGDGFPILVDGHLVILTKNGGLHVAPASPEGYREIATVKLFEATWTPPSFAGGRFYARGFDGIAAIEPRAGGVAESVTDAVTTPQGAVFDRFLAEVAEATDKAQVIDRFLAEQESFPIIEGDWVHFLYRGEAADMAIAGDIIGFRSVAPMKRVEGSDLYYYSTKLQPDARVSYYFVKDFDERLTDPRNPRKAIDVRDKLELNLPEELSWVGMPEWQPPADLTEAPPERRGRIENLRLPMPPSPVPGPPGAPPGAANERQVDVYLPVGYDEQSEHRYPVVYVHSGNPAMQWGGWKQALDNLIGKSVEPVIVAFIHSSSRLEFSFGAETLYSTLFAQVIVPEIDRRYRTLATPQSRASVGFDATGYAALFSAFHQPGVVSKVAAQSAFLLTSNLKALDAVMGTAGESAPFFFVDWGTYDSRSDQEAWDYREGSKTLVELLEKRGYAVTATEVNDGYGWPAWRNRTGKILEWLYPLSH